MPAVAIVVDVIVSDIAGAAIVDAVGEAVGSMLIGDIVSGAVIGAVGGAAQAAVTGGNIWKGVEYGAIGGAVSGGVTGELAGTASYTDPVTGVVTEGSKGLITGTNGLVSAAQGGSAGLNALSQGLGSAAGTYAVTGDPRLALESGGITGLVNYAIPTTGLSGGDRALAQSEQAAISMGLRSLLTPSQKSNREYAGGIMSRVSPGQGSPSSSALGQVLNSGSPIIGSGSDQEKKKPGAWNTESLKYMGSEE
jgi:hypothetical protein